MARNGSGTFIRLYNWEQDAANNIKIRADRMDAEMDGMADALTGSIASDGQTPVTANLPMSGMKHTNVADATQRNQYATWGQAQDNTAQWGGTDTGAADAYEISPTPVVTAYAAGQMFRFKVGTGNTNTGAATISVNGLPTRNLKDQDGNDPAAGAIRAGALYEVTYDGINFFLNPAFDYAGDLSIQKTAASLDIGKGGFAGPHTVDFYDVDDSIGISWVYDTGNEELTAELSDGTELLNLDKSGNLAVGNDISLSGVLTTGQITLQGNIITDNDVNIERTVTGGLDVRTADNNGDYIFSVRSSGSAQRLTVAHGAPELRGASSGWTINGVSVLTEGDISTSDVLDAISGASAGAVGTYAFLAFNLGGGGEITSGSTRAGSNLRYSGVFSDSTEMPTGGTPSGTWRLMGYINNPGVDSQWFASEWLRIS